MGNNRFLLSQRHGPRLQTTITLPEFRFQLRKDQLCLFNRGQGNSILFSSDFNLSLLIRQSFPDSINVVRSQGEFLFLRLQSFFLLSQLAPFRIDL